jgi:DNA-binding NarL/FixJ family response regulator
MFFINFHTTCVMQKIKCIFCLLFTFLLSQQIQAFKGKYPIQNFSPSDYKAGIQNIDFAQNRNMTLFVANNLGVLSYNGIDWYLHASKTGKKIRSLAFDDQTNRLYFGSQGAFGYFDEDWNYISLVEKIPASASDFDEVWDVFLFHSKVYFCTFEGIYVYDGQAIAAIENEGGFYRSFQANGKLFAQSRRGKFFEIKDKTLLPVNFSQAAGNETIAGVVQQDEGYLIFYNSGKIELASNFGAAKKYDDLSRALQGKYVNHVLQLSDTRLAISTQTAGLFLYDLQTHFTENITTNDGLLSNVCLRSFQDHAGNLWVGMQNGIALIDINSPMRIINEEIGIQGSGYEAFDREDGTYYTTSNGIYFLSKNATKSMFLQGTEGPAYDMQKIAGKLYAGHHTGLFLLENGRAKRIAETHGLWQVKQLRSKPEYAIGGTYSGLYLFKLGSNLELQPVQKIGGFSESSRFFEEDQKGRIWVGQFYKGLYQVVLPEDLSKATVKKVSEEYGFPLDEQIILSSIDNELFVATRKGVYKIDPMTDKIEAAALFSQDIGGQEVYLLAQDNQKNIHVYTENQVGFFKQISPNNYTFVPSSLFQLRYSFNNDLLNISVNMKDGVFFNANEGFIQYRPELENRMALEKPIVIRKVFSVTEDSILYAQKPFDLKPEKIGKLVVSHRAKVLQFDIEAFQFNEVNNQQFRYFLKGFDEYYGEWTNAPSKEYTNLTEGEYEFTVQTKNYLGQIVTSQPLFLEVKPPFHRSLLARIFYVALGILALLLVSKRQKRIYKRKTTEVEAAKQHELAKKQQELIELEGQKEQKLRQLEEDNMKRELQHLNNLLAASTMNLVVKNEFMETIKEELKEVRRKGKSTETKQSLEKIVKEIDSTLRLQEDWAQFEFHFDQVHGDFLNRLREQFLDLTPNEQKLCAFLRLNLNTKEIANLMGISLRGVEIARYRLRKKLGIDQGQNLSKFILEY